VLLLTSPATIGRDFFVSLAPLGVFLAKFRQDWAGVKTCLFYY